MILDTFKIRQQKKIDSSLKLNELDTIVEQRGRSVLFETAVKCSCKSKAVNSLPDCKNCGGLGWFYVNKRQTKMIYSSISITTENKPWSEEVRGMLSFTSKNDFVFNYYDRITILSTRSRYSEVIHLSKIDNTTYVGYTSYPIYSLKYCGLFLNSSSNIKQIYTGITVNKNQIKISLDLESQLLISNTDDVSVSIIYSYYPIYYVEEIKRENSSSELLKGSIENIPNTSFGRRAHYLFQNLSSVQLNMNSYEEIDSIDLLYRDGQYFDVKLFKESFEDGLLPIDFHTTKPQDLDINIVDELSEFKTEIENELIPLK